MEKENKTDITKFSASAKRLVEERTGNVQNAPLEESASAKITMDQRQEQIQSNRREQHNIAPISSATPSEKKSAQSNKSGGSK
jgi:hypothetical protein